MYVYFLSTYACTHTFICNVYRLLKFKDLFIVSLLLMSSHLYTFNEDTISTKLQKMMNLIF